LLVAAIRQGAADRGVDPAELFPDPAVRVGWFALAHRASSPAGNVDADRAAELASAAGLDPVEVFHSAAGKDLFTPALARAGGQVDVRRLGMDLTVSAPKSVSVLAALADPDITAVIEGCHDRAVTQALGYLQRHAAHGLRGHHGDGHTMTRVGTDGLIVAGFTHHTSRADDPQLHTHLVIPNLVRGADGQWSAVDSRAVFRQAKTAGYLYQATLRHELCRELGVSWTVPVKGCAEIIGIPQTVLVEFSQRRRQITTELARTGRHGRRAAQAACLSTRTEKSHLPTGGLQASWAARATTAGVSPGDLLQVVKRASRHRASWTARGREIRGGAGRVNDRLASHAEQAVLAGWLFGPDGLTEHQTGFDRRDIVRALAEYLPPDRTGNAAQLETLADQLLSGNTGDIGLADGTANGVAGPNAAVPLAVDLDDGPRWTTTELLLQETQAIALAASPVARPAPPARLVQQQITARPGLSAEQQAAIWQLAGNRNLACVLVGPAGSGKTAALSTLRDIFETDGRPVIGCALAALTARRLQDGSGIPSSSLAALLARADTVDPTSGHPAGLPARVVVVVDEASLIGTRQLGQLLQHTARAGGQVLLVGDPAQLPEIDAGGLFRHLAAPDQGPAVLRGNQRQQQAWEIAALDQLRDGHIQTALHSYAARDRITLAPGMEELHEQIAADYLAHTASATTPRGVRETVVLATRRNDVGALNTAIRAQLQQAGRLAPDTLTVTGPDGPLPLAVGDQIILTRTTHDADCARVLNGTRGQVTQAGADGIQLETDDGQQHTLSPLDAGFSLQHGYALTIHKAQGLTAITALVLADGLTRNAAYTALSRGRRHNELYLHDPEGQTSGQDPLRRFRAQLDQPTGDTLAVLQRPRWIPPTARRRTGLAPYPDPGASARTVPQRTR
ncbi:MAG: relaxase domain-containing protein, partial [Actinomycetota bacterium]|nr:relaxase domain-containing protein [Actinomycetota bacterium]